jgi:flagellar protein FlaF
MQQHNPYQQASSAYSNNKAASLSDPRTMEAQALLKAAAKLDAIREMLKNNEKTRLADIMPALDYHKKLWIVFADSAADQEHPLPQEIKNNIASLAVFMFKRVIDVMAEPKAEKLDVMIEINRQLASGLMKTPPKEDNGEKPSSEASEQKPENNSVDA